MKHIRIILPLLLLTWFGCGSGEQSTEDVSRDDAVQRAEEKAREASNKLTGTLLGAVQSAMKEGGPAHAVRQCAVLAQDLTRSVGDENGVILRRITERPRNPLDTPDAYERRILLRFEADQSAGTLDAAAYHAEVVVTDGKRTLRYLKPLTIKKPCLTCHGSREQVGEDVQAELKERYPADRAMGYHEGDLRGAISVIVPLED